MLLTIGYLIVLFSIIGGFLLAGGSLILLLHVSEFIVIGGISVGILVIASPKDVLMNIIHDIKESFTGSKIDKNSFLDLLKLLYEMFMLGRRNGLVALDEHVTNPKTSSILTKYPKFLENKEALNFFVNAFRPIIDGKIKPDQLDHILNTEIESMEDEAASSVGILSLIGDSLPGVGIVAAVLGIINTMSAIAEGPAKVGEKVAAALTGTFLGVLGAYGFVNPLTKRIHFAHRMHFLYFRIMASAITGFAKGYSPIMAAEIARRSLDQSIKPSAEELEETLKSIGKT